MKFEKIKTLSLKILLFTHPDVDDLIKDDFYFLTHPNGAVTLRLRQKNGSIQLPHFIFGFDGGLVRFLSIFVTLFVIREFQVTAVQLQREEKDAYVVSR